MAVFGWVFVCGVGVGVGCGGDAAVSADVAGSGADAGVLEDGGAVGVDVAVRVGDGGVSDAAPGGRGVADGGAGSAGSDAAVEGGADGDGWPIESLDGERTAGGDAADGLVADAGPVEPYWAPEAVPTGVLHTALTIDLGSLTGAAVIDHEAVQGAPVVLDIRGLKDVNVTPGAGTELLDAQETGGLLTVTATSAGDAVTLAFTYGFSAVAQGDFEGYMESGSTLLWPYHCGNLFPCATDPNDGMTWTLEVIGLPEGVIAVYPATVTAEAPAYSVAFAVGDYGWQSVGVTAQGTEVGFWATPESMETGATGTADLPAVFEWLEETLGPYTFGSPVGPVSVDWGPGAYGGIEHHPRWHVSRGAFHDLAVHAHEAAHGWFGNGVRLACWEDLVLSEGTCNYLAARAIEVAVGTEASDKVWNSYQGRLDQYLTFGLDHVAWPHTCEADFDVIEDGLFSQIPYLKGAFFFRDVGTAVGFDALDAALGTFYRHHHNRPGTMDALLSQIEVETGFDARPLAAAWLEVLGVPE